MNSTAASQTLDLAHAVLRHEAQALLALSLDDAFAQAVDRIAACTGTLAVSGVGKAGIIGQKIAATLSSLGMPAQFLHATECFHGDLGRVRTGDTAILLSNSGTTREVVDLAHVLVARAIPIIAITADAQSPLARAATAALAYGRTPEACHLGLAPTTSTTVMLALGDALAVCAAKTRGLTPEQYWAHHPKGSLGMVGLPVLQAARYRVGKNLAIIEPTTCIRDAFQISETEAAPMRRPGAILIADASQKLLGIFTDGDLRRAFLQHGPAVWTAPIAAHMTAAPRHLLDTDIIQQAVTLFEQHRIDELPVTDANEKVVALLDIQDVVALNLMPH
jgi:arabinose-5-phosphate isomerase